MVLVLKSAAVYFGSLGLMNGSQLLIPSSCLLLTTELLAIVSIPKESIQGRGHIYEMPRGVMLLGKYLIPKAEAECTLQRVMGLVGYAIFSMCWRVAYCSTSGDSKSRGST